MRTKRQLTVKPREQLDKGIWLGGFGAPKKVIQRVESKYLIKDHWKI